ncbi:MAG TPA: NUDIX domain-containing protein [Polyangiales bacterium]|nr:NUDIX domain-containing protein [Polyangiales bacterium]
MTEEEVQELARLLRKASAEGLGVPRLPKAAFVAMKGVIKQPTVEVLITRDGRDLLFTPRHDKDWDGWHVPGGFVGAEESLEQACARIGSRELGVTVTLERLVGHYSWTDHPYASAISLLCLCRADAAPKDGQFFAELPANLITQHRAMLERWWPPR